TLSVFSLDGSGKTKVIQEVKTQYGARTIALDPLSGHLYLPATDYTKNEQGKDIRTPNTFNVLVVKK
ncbi:MAG: hypothetical protein JKY59_09465, partial [Emcibacter sp.]|nr:hypothetical protein [Emcibacter sp.]